MKSLKTPSASHLIKPINATHSKYRDHTLIRKVHTSVMGKACTDQFSLLFIKMLTEVLVFVVVVVFLASAGPPAALRGVRVFPEASDGAAHGDPRDPGAETADDGVHRGEAEQDRSTGQRAPEQGGSDRCRRPAAHT